jgi:uncharacterized membrane protein YgcG
VYFETTQLLAPYQGLTIVVMFPKGIIEPPPPETLARFWIGSHRAETLGIIGLVVLLAYYLVTWMLMGVDPRRGKVTPELEPPDGLSPAALRYVANMGADFTAFTAALTSMATKGYLRIEVDGGGTHTITRHKADEDVLSGEELSLGRALFSGRTSVLVDQDNHAILTAARQAMQRSLRAKHQRGYFNRNVPVMVWGVLASVALLIAMGLVFDGEKAVYFVCTAMGGVSLAFLFLTLLSLLPGQAGVASSMANSSQPASLSLALFLALFAAISLGVMYFFVSPWLSLIITAYAALNTIFIPLLPKYTRRGRQLLDRIEGYRLALRGQDASLPGSQQDASAVLAFMPYAIALGVHRQWAQQLEQMFRTAERPPMPVWYHDPHDRYYRHERLANDLAGSFTQSISSASTAPGSSSGGGGGGSSGGGGGGGGGGGW